MNFESKDVAYSDTLFKFGWIIFLLAKIVLIQRRNEVRDCTCFVFAVMYVLLIGMDKSIMKSGAYKDLVMETDE
jgi:hypothetical protein